jgi:RimJ/RimL family protein N-acetyltransferase
VSSFYPDLVIRQLRPEDAEVYATFRRAALLDTPLAFMASPEDDMACSTDAVRERLKAGGVILGAFDPELIGTLGLYRDQHIKAAHKVHVWGMYVAPEHRQRGVGARLLEAAIQYARSLGGISMVRLSVSSAAPAAQRLYERAGFRIWGTEPDSLRHNGKNVIEYHMLLQITR